MGLLMFHRCVEFTYTAVQTAAGWTRLISTPVTRLVNVDLAFGSFKSGFEDYSTAWHRSENLWAHTTRTPGRLQRNCLGIASASQRKEMEMRISADYNSILTKETFLFSVCCQ
jgi:hypothetical protein